MYRTLMLRPLAIALACMAALAVLRFKPWAHAAEGSGRAVSGATSGERERLTVGFLPVT